MLHHHTLLVDADLDTLRAVLAVPRVRLETHAVRSVPAQVANLRDYLKELTLHQVVEAFLHQARRRFGTFTEMITPCSTDQLQAETRKLEAQAWIWDATPRFQSSIELPENHGRLDFTVRQGRIEDVHMKGQHLAAAVGLPFRNEFPARIALETGLDSDLVREAFTSAGFHGV